MSEIREVVVARIVQDLRDTYVEAGTRRVFYRGSRTLCFARQGFEQNVEQRLKECACVEIDNESMGKPFERPMNLVCRLTEWFSNGTELWPDFAPLSFMFFDRGLGIYGGLILHGVHDRGGDGGPPTYSVCFTPCNGWSIHT